MTSIKRDRILNLKIGDRLEQLTGVRAGRVVEVIHVGDQGGWRYRDLDTGRPMRRSSPAWSNEWRQVDSHGHLEKLEAGDV